MTNPNINKLIFLKYIVFSLSIYISCSYVPRNQIKPKSSSVMLTYHLEFPKTDGSISTVSDSINIFKEGDFMIYKDKAQHIYTKVQLDKNMKEIGEKVMLDTITYNYVIFKKNCKHGLFYDSMNVLKPERISIDSFKHSRTLDQIPFFNEKNDSLVSSVKSSSTPNLIEIRVPKKVTGSSYADKKIYYYTKSFTDAPFAFSLKLDSIAKMKLYKIRFLYKAPKDGTPTSAREFSFELKKAKPDVNLSKLIENFEAVERKFNLR